MDYLLNYLDEYSHFYPDVWKKYDFFRSVKGKDIPDWPDWCYCPLSVAYSIEADVARRANIPKSQIVPDIGNLGALAAWRMNKTVYRFSPVLLDALSKSNIKQIPVNALYNMPSWCVYIDVGNFDWGIPNLRGWFAYLDWDIKKEEPELRFTFDTDKGLVPCMINLSNPYLSGCLEDTIKESLGHLSLRQMIIVPQREEFHHFSKFISLYLAALLYLCSVDPDVTPKNTRSPHPNYPYRTIMRLKVGFHPEIPKNSTEIHQKPYIRKAHWHMYRVGPGRKGTALRWINPTMVGFNKPI